MENKGQYGLMLALIMTVMMSMMVPTYGELNFPEVSEISFLRTVEDIRGDRTYNSGGNDYYGFEKTYSGVVNNLTLKMAVTIWEQGEPFDHWNLKAERDRLLENELAKNPVNEYIHEPPESCKSQRLDHFPTTTFVMYCMKENVFFRIGTQGEIDAVEQTTVIMAKKIYDKVDKWIPPTDESDMIICGKGTYLVDGICKPRPDQIEESSVTLTSAKPRIVDQSNNPVSIIRTGDNLFVSIEVENLGEQTENFVAAYRFLTASVGDWSEWMWVSASVNVGKYTDISIPWNPTTEDSHEFDIQIWDNIQDKNIISDEKIVVNVNPPQITTQTVEDAVIKQSATVTTEEKAILPFVNPDKDPQHYIDRYNNESVYKDWFDYNYPDYTIEEAVGLKLKPKIPEWIKGVFAFYLEGQIGDEELIKALQFLIKEGIIKI